MKSIILAALAAFLLTASTAAQSRPRYVFDNFSTGVVKVDTPAKPGVKPGSTAKPAKQLVKKTVSSAPLGSAANARSKGPKSLRGYSTGSDTIDGYIVDSCTRYGIDPLLIFAQMNQESSFKLKALSNKGASGLMQLMPATARRFGVTDIWDPQQNIDAGVKYMRWLLDTFNGDMSLALAGYNAGEGAVMKYGWEIPPYNETQDYVRRISARYNSLLGGASTRFDYSSEAKNTINAYPSKIQTPEVKKSGRMNIDEQPVYMVKNANGQVRLISK